MTNEQGVRKPIRIFGAHPEEYCYSLYKAEPYMLDPEKGYDLYVSKEDYDQAIARAEKVQTLLDIKNIQIESLEAEVKRLREHIRVMILWGECISMKLSYEDRKEINWRVRDEAKQALERNS